MKPICGVDSAEKGEEVLKRIAKGHVFSAKVPTVFQFPLHTVGTFAETTCPLATLHKASSASSRQSTQEVGQVLQRNRILSWAPLRH